MRLLVPLLLVAISGNSLAQTQHVTDTRASVVVQPDAGGFPAQTPFSGAAPLSSSLFRSPGTDAGTYDNLGMRQAKPGAPETAAGCRQQPALANGCTVRPPMGN